VSILIRRITLAALLAAFAAGSLALPASSKPGPVAHASKCKKKGKKAGKAKKKKCKRGQQSQNGLPGQATHPTPTQPTPPPVPPTILASNLSVTDDPILAGTSTSGQVTISEAAPSGGQVVALSSDSSRVTVPGSVLVPAGLTKAGFTIDSSSGPPVTATLSAAIGTSIATTPLSVVDVPSVSSVALERQCFTGPATFNANRVTLDVPAPTDTVVNLSSDGPALVVPLTVTVPSGSRSALFGVTTSLTPPPSAIVTASLGSSDATDSASVSATSPTPAVATLTLQTNDVSVGTPVQGTVTLDCEALPGGTTVNVQSDVPGIDVQGPVVVPQDQLSTTFTISTSVSGTATITAGGAPPVTLQVNELGT
jgi:hypothetical protein